MARQRRWPPDMLLGLFVCSIAFLCDGAATRTSSSNDVEQNSNAIHVLPQPRPQTLTRRRQDGHAQVNHMSRTSTTIAPTPTKPSQRIVSTTSTAYYTVTVTASPTPRKRNFVDISELLESIDSLQEALASATASAVSLSREFAVSINQLESSTQYLAASASSALLVAEASASKALAAAEASAAKALSAVEESAASSISEVLAVATSTIPRTSNDTYRVRLCSPLDILVVMLTVRQTQVDNGDESSVSPAIVGIAVAVSVVGSSLISLLVFFFFTRRRKAKQRAQEEENEMNAALDRAIVSYIVKELPSPQGSTGQQTGQRQFWIEDKEEGDAGNSFAPSPPGPTEPTPTGPSDLHHVEELPPTPPSPQSGMIPIQAMPSPKPSTQPPSSRSSLDRVPRGMSRSRSHRSPRMAKPPPAHMRSHSQTTPSPSVRSGYFGHQPSASDASGGSAWYQPSMTPSSIAISRALSRRTASSHFMDSAEKIYGDILTSPLEKDPLEAPYQPAPEPPVNTLPKSSSEVKREDVGWPLPAKEAWL
ncbi:uncharacterized protein PODANS_6_9710 [Podospora anserina S mat+]|uniref:Podospora anserina S mat+ genomic DNA chromosome 6, supercontig 4 n=1 Tax=Podospora anserina (strain S / ATCC MYA-4624 / DSM 980 / FGSC 10383) TaxID=515849 RepID=B2ANP9_PODAN|nr:uncharacterized protein PODANS_6_9710 [Podospora anserina S mat+]CAP65471.1 unnamed protein product [Podospora anserina S mat+]CDP31467.1 Putative protein of unknown function [Podospora anserina S mat+]